MSEGHECPKKSVAFLDAGWPGIPAPSACAEADPPAAEPL